MSDFEDVENFENPGMHPTETDIVAELLFSAYNDNLTRELYETYDKAEIVQMLGIMENEEVVLDALLKSDKFRNLLHNELLNYKSSLRIILNKYYSGQTRAQIRAAEQEDENDVEFENDE